MCFFHLALYVETRRVNAKFRRSTQYSRFRIRSLSALQQFPTFAVVNAVTAGLEPCVDVAGHVCARLGITRARRFVQCGGLSARSRCPQLMTLLLEFGFRDGKFHRFMVCDHPLVYRDGRDQLPPNGWRHVLTLSHFESTQERIWITILVGQSARSQAHSSWTKKMADNIEFDPHSLIPSGAKGARLVWRSSPTLYIPDLAKFADAPFHSIRQLCPFVPQKRSG